MVGYASGRWELVQTLYPVIQMVQWTAFGLSQGPGCELCTLPWWGSLRFTLKCFCCRHLEGRCQRHFPAQCLAWSWGLRQLWKPQQVGRFWWPAASSHQALFFRSLWRLVAIEQERWKRRVFWLDHGICFGFAPDICGVTHHVWLCVPLMLMSSLVKALIESLN